MPSLFVQQRCAHHITSVCIRNLTIALEFDSSFEGPPNSNHELFLYFTLHTNSRTDKDELFRSEVVPYNPDPTWKNIKVSASKPQSFTSVVVRLWFGKGDGFMPALQWDISLTKINCIGDYLDPHLMTFHSNAVIVGMHKTYFACSSSVSVHDNSPLYDLNTFRSSYEISALQRLFANILESTKYKQGSVRLDEDSKLLLSGKKEVTRQLEKELENVRRTINHLKNLLKREKALFDREKQVANEMRINNEQRQTKLNEDEESLKSERSKFQQKHKACLNKKLLLAQTTTQLIAQRQILLSDLALIFPIANYQGVLRTKSKKKAVLEENTSDNLLSICNVKLPAAEKFHHKDDLHTSVALGYTSQLVIMISQILLVPLRYPIIHKGSASTIVDLVTEKMTDRERIFPLHVKGSKERFLFDYGVFLLNKNIAHLRYLCCQGTTDIRNTLQNLKLFFEERFGAKLLLESPATNIGESPHQLNRISSAHSLVTDASLVADNKNSENKDNRKPAAKSQTLKQSKFLRSDSVPCTTSYVKNPSGNMRNQLLGLKEEDPQPPVKPLKYMRTSTVATLKARNDSTDSLTAAAGSTTYLTGLEQSNASARDVKMSLAEARAELLGKQTGPRKRGASDKWSKRSNGDPTRNVERSNSVFSLSKSSVSSGSFSVSTSSLTRDDDLCECNTADDVAFKPDFFSENSIGSARWCNGQMSGLPELVDWVRFFVGVGSHQRLFEMVFTAALLDIRHYGLV